MKAFLNAHFSVEAYKRPLGHGAAVNSNTTQLRGKKSLKNEKETHIPLTLLSKEFQRFPCPSATPLLFEAF